MLLGQRTGVSKALDVRLVISARYEEVLRRCLKIARVSGGGEVMALELGRLASKSRNARLPSVAKQNDR